MRAVGRIVVWVDAEAEVRTVILRKNTMTAPTTPPPNTTEPIPAKTSSALSGLPIPMPVEPTPATETAAIETMA